MSVPQGFEQLTAPEQLEWAARQTARAAGVDPDLVSAIGQRESGFNAQAIGRAGEIGAFQIMPATGQALGYTPAQLQDPVTNVEAGIKLLSQLSQKYQGDVHTIAGAYNGGEHATDQGHLPLSSRGYASAIAGTVARMKDASAPAKAVDIPSAAALTEQSQQRQERDLPWLQQMAGAVIEPPTQLLETAGRIASGSSIPSPTMGQLGSDVIQTAGLAAPGFRIGRLASSLVQAGVGADAALQAAVTEHAKGDASWSEQLRSMTAGDMFAVGASTLLGAVLGAALPGESAAPLTQRGGLAKAGDLGSLAPRAVDDQAVPPMRAAVKEAFGKLDKTAIVDATDWRDVILAHQAAGKGVPSEVRAALGQLTPVTERVPIQVPELGPAGMQMMDSLGRPLMTTQVVERATGSYTAPAGVLLDANMALGNMVNTADARSAAAALGHSAGNLKALRDTLSETIQTTLPGDQASLYATARQTSAESAQNFAALRQLEKFANPDEGRLNGAGLYDALTKGSAAKARQLMGSANYQDVLAFARSVKQIGLQPQKINIYNQLLHIGSLGVIARYVGGPEAVAPAVGAYLGTRVLYSLATNQVTKTALDQIARFPVGTKTFTTALGRYAMAHALASSDVQRDQPPLSTAPPSPEMPPLPPGTRMPAP